MHSSADTCTVLLLQCCVNIYKGRNIFHCVELSVKKYYHHREKSKRDPKKYLTIIIDGMDQSKTDVPQLTTTTKSSQNLWRLRTHLTGKLVHACMPTILQCVYMYMSICHIRGGWDDVMGEHF